MRSDRPDGDLWRPRPPEPASPTGFVPGLGEALVVAMGALPLAAAVVWGLGFPLSPVALVLAAAVVTWAVGPGRRLATLLATVSLVAACAAASLVFLDVSWDGQAYHQGAVLSLSGGWNPFRDPPLSSGAFGESFTNAYAKGAWASGAAFVTLTGRIETAKAFSLCWPIAVFVLAFGTLAPFLRSRIFAAGLATALALNPVALLQLFATTVDGQLASTVTAALLLAVRLARWPSRATASAFAFALVALCNQKLTGVAFAPVLGLAALGLAAPRGGRFAARTALLLVATAVLAVFFVGYNPYVTNTLRYGHPAHPVLGPGKIDVEAGQAAGDFRSRGRTEKLLASLFAESSNALTRPSLRPPFLFRARELRAFSSWDVRFGGFGPLFSGALLASLPLLGVLLLRAGPHRLPAAVVLAAIAAMVAVNPESWWARLAPQTWLVPAGTAVLGALAGTPRLRRASACLCALLLVNVALVAGPYLFGQVVFSASLRSQLDGLRAASLRDGPLLVRPNRFSGVPRRLSEAGVRFREVSDLGGRPSVTLALSRADVAAPSGQLLPEAGSPAQIAAESLERFGIDGAALGLAPR